MIALTRDHYVVVSTEGTVGEATGHSKRHVIQNIIF